MDAVLRGEGCRPDHPRITFYLSGVCPHKLLDLGEWWEGKPLPSPLGGLSLVQFVKGAIAAIERALRDGVQSAHANPSKNAGCCHL